MGAPEPPVVPEDGFTPADFPQLSVVQIPYTSTTLMRPDPMITIGQEDHLAMDLGTVRIVIPDRQEWSKLVWMVEALWNTHELNKQHNEEKTNDDVSTDGQGQLGQHVPVVDQL